uniref:Uncharacterized protein n=1 Tax=Clytia hemisphaerica TaxID=252671 RepID=A0A7M5V1X9_9CNID
MRGDNLEDQIHSLRRLIERQSLRLEEKLTSLEDEVKEIKNRSPSGGGQANQGFIGDVYQQKGDINMEYLTDLEAKKASTEEDSVIESHKDFAEGLTIHGLSRIAAGGTAAKVLWTILVIASFIIAVLISKEHWSAFLEHDSRTSTKIVSQSKVPIPAITICDHTAIANERRRFSGEPPPVKRPTLVDFSIVDCARNLTACGYNGTTFVRVQNISANYARASPQNHLVKFDETTDCFTITGEVLEMPSDVLSYQAAADRRLSSNEWTELYVNSVDETFFESSEAVYWASEGFYYVNIEKKIITRLGLPFTECVDGSGPYSLNKFKGNYSVMKCQKGCFWEAVFEKCGQIPAMYKKHMRHPEKFANKTFVDDETGQACLSILENDHALTEKCDNLCELDPCYDEDIKLSLFHNPMKLDHFLELAFTFQSFLLEIVAEKPQYTWQDLFANFGGCLGLMTGSSILSIIELIIFFGLFFANFLRSKKKNNS